MGMPENDAREGSGQLWAYECLALLLLLLAAASKLIQEVVQAGSHGSSHVKNTGNALKMTIPGEEARRPVHGTGGNLADEVWTGEEKA